MDAEQPGPKRTPKQDADLRRHLGYQDSQRQGEVTDVFWGFPLGMIVVVMGALICGLGLVVWGALITFRAMYRGISG